MMKGVNLRINATNKSGPAMASASRGLKGLAKAQRSVQRTNVGFMKGMSANRRIVQQVGMQVSDLGVQIAGGQSALLSLTQNVPQVVQMFGAWGGILAAVITLLGTFSLVMIKSGKGINDIIPFTGSLQNEFTGLAKTFGVMKDAVLDGVNFLINNLDLLFFTLSIVSGLMVGKFILGFLRSTGTLKLFNTALLVTRKRGLGAGLALIKARGGALLFANALNFVKKAIIATGIGALIVGLGYLTERLFTLRQATGSWGETLKLVGDLAKQVFMQLPNIIGGVFLKIRHFQLSMVAGFSDMLADMLASVGSWADPVIGVFVGIKDAIFQVFATIGAALLNPIRDGINAMIGLVVSGINMMLEKVNKIPGVDIPLIPPDFKKFTGIVVDDTKTFGQRVKDAFNKGLGGTYVGQDGVLTKGTREASDRIKSLAKQIDMLATKMLGSANDAIPAWEKIKKLLASIQTDKFDIRSVFGNKDELDEMLGGKTDPVKIKTKIIPPDMKPIADTMDVIKEMGESISRTLNNSFKSLIRGSKSLKDVMVDVLNTIADKLIDLALNPIFDSIGAGIAGIFSGGTGGIFSNVLGSLFSFNGGGYTGNGSRSGGLDGRGGFLAVLHPKESVVDHTKTKNPNKMNNAKTRLPAAKVASNIVITNHNLFNGVTHEEVMRDVEKSQDNLKKQIDKEMPSKIDNHNFNKRRGVA
jgi:hypothetical protein